MISVTEAANIMGVARQTVHYHIEHCNLTRVTRVGNQFVLSKAEVEEYHKNNKKY
jgi:excisionase family DNA binding protein